MLAMNLNAHRVRVELGDTANEVVQALEMMACALKLLEAALDPTCLRPSIPSDC
jgi:hypothetical protein